MYPVVSCAFGVFVAATRQFSPAIDESPSIMIMGLLRHADRTVFAAGQDFFYWGRDFCVRKLTELTETQSQRWQRLMVAAQAAEPRAYTLLLKECSSFIRAIARRYHADAGTIEDVVQETLISIHRIRNTYEPGRAVEPWIAAIAKARAIDALRSRKRRQRLEQPVEPETLANIPAEMISNESVMAASSTIEVALSNLTPSQRAAVKMLKIEELSLREASQASGQSVQSLKSALHRAMQALRSSLSGDRDA
jgi:RNA polymerase sigma-70 factor (ECF subfamily)